MSFLYHVNWNFHFLFSCKISTTSWRTFIFIIVCMVPWAPYFSITILFWWICPSAITTAVCTTYSYWNYHTFFTSLHIIFLLHNVYYLWCLTKFNYTISQFFLSIFPSIFISKKIISGISWTSTNGNNIFLNPLPSIILLA